MKLSEKAYVNAKYTYDLAMKRAKQAKVFPKWADNQQVKNQILQIYILAQMKNLTTRKKWHVDHIIPISGYNVCGLHVPTNLRVISKQANEHKSNAFVPYFERNGKRTYCYEAAEKLWDTELKVYRAPRKGKANPTRKSLQKMAKKIIFRKRNFYKG